MPEKAPPSSIGPLLKKRRAALKLNLADVELATKIRGKYLVRIEAGEWAALPNDIYTKGFVLKYADFLGLDGAAVVRQYLVERGGGVEQAAQNAPKPVG